MKKTNILQVTASMDIGGLETFIMNLLRNIDRDKFQFIFLTYAEAKSSNGKFDYEDEVNALGGKIIRMEPPKINGLFYNLKQLIKIIKEEKIDVIHCHTYFSSGFFLLAGKLAKVKTRIVHSHTTLGSTKVGVRKTLKWLRARIYIRLFSTDKFACGKEAGYALYRKDKSLVIPNGINFPQFSYNEKYRKEIRDELKIEDDVKIIGHVGRLDYPKNHKFLIDIFEEYKKLNSKSKLILVGDGKLKEELIKKVKSKNLINDIIFLGSRQDVYKIYNSFDLFLFPSIYEGIPVTLIEAQVNGLSCLVSSNVPKECKLTDNINFYSLDNTSKEWAEKLDNFSLNRIDETYKIKNSDYNIQNGIKKIEQIYLKR